MRLKNKVKKKNKKKLKYKSNSIQKLCENRITGGLNLEVSSIQNSLRN